MKIRKQMKKGIITIALVICFSMIAPGPGAGVFAATGEDADARLASSPVSLQAGSDRTPLGREWRKSFNKNGYLYSNMAQLANGNIVAVGEAHVPKGSASSRFAVLCFDPNGKQLWERLYNKDAAESTSASFFTSVVAAQDGGFVAVGATSAEKGELASEAGVLIRFDDQGDVKWIRSFKNREFVRVVSSGDGGFAAIGSIPQPKAKADATFLVRVDAGGTALWEKVFPQTNRGGYTDLILCADGGFAALGETNPKDISKTYAFLARFDKDGNNKWIKTYKKAGHLRLTSLVQLSDGRFAAAGAASRTFLRDGVLAKFDDACNFMWRKYYG